MPTGISNVSTTRSRRPIVPIRFMHLMSRREQFISFDYHGVPDATNPERWSQAS
jgi:hypothetical protein